MSTLNLILKLDSSIVDFLAIQKPIAFSVNSWLIAIPYNISDTEPKSPQDFIETTMQSVSLQVNSKVYPLLISGPVSNASVVLYESYRIGDTSKPILSRRLGYYDGVKMHFTNSDYIWERRRNLDGYKFKVSAVSSPPFVFLNHANVTKLYS